MNRSIFLWSAIAALTAVWELASYIMGVETGRDYATPTISMLVAPFIAHRAGLALFTILWFVAGVAIIRKPKPGSLSLPHRFIKYLLNSNSHPNTTTPPTEVGE
jgi:hypothetical protein